MGCWFTKQVKHTPGYEEPAVLAAETASVTISEVEALYELFRKISYSIIKDGLIHKEEFQLALFKNSKKNNLFADRLDRKLRPFDRKTTTGARSPAVKETFLPFVRVSASPIADRLRSSRDFPSFGSEATTF
ncbi:hypothetical protein M5K25_024987 [Dendrobium thyrsiflorum]|uniref:Calcineurin B-like protein n=1 Tax=Dendrobium thyrsiflorum TaxID=117978 RepID=A0ABD0U3I2_DENTH